MVTEVSYLSTCGGEDLIFWCVLLHVLSNNQVIWSVLICHTPGQYKKYANDSSRIYAGLILLITNLELTLLHKSSLLSFLMRVKFRATHCLCITQSHSVYVYIIWTQLGCMLYICLSNYAHVDFFFLWNSAIAQMYIARAYNIAISYRMSIPCVLYIARLYIRQR